MKSLLRRRFPHAALGGTALQQLGGNAEASIPTAIYIANSSPNPAIEEPHEQESDDVGDGSSLSCHGV